MTDLEWIEDWYASHCDGNWEHQFGVELETVDNPGWGLRIELKSTPHEGCSRAWEKIDRTADDWVHWSVSGNRFIGYCGARNLQELLGTVRRFLESDPASSMPQQPFRGSIRDGRPWGSVTHDTREGGAIHYSAEE